MSWRFSFDQELEPKIEQVGQNLLSELSRNDEDLAHLMKEFEDTEVINSDLAQERTTLK